MRTVVRDGTERNERSLCLSCKNSTVVRGHRMEPIMECSEINNTSALNRMQPVLRCSAYHQKGQPTIYHLQQIAWELKPNKNTGKLGFHKPETNKHTSIFIPHSGEEF